MTDNQPILGVAYFLCPHCGASYQRSFTRFPEIETQYCYEDEGGCGATFAVRGRVEILTTATAHKIEGMGPTISAEDLAQLRHDRALQAEMDAEAEFGSSRQHAADFSPAEDF